MSKKKKRSFLKTTKKALEKHNEIEKVKKEKKVKHKKNKPKGYAARMAGMITFWFLFSFMLLFVIVNVFFSNKSSSIEEQVVTTEMDKITSHESIEFARSFVYEYFNVDPNNEEENKMITKYLSDNLKFDQVSLNVGKDWKSYLKWEDIIVKNVEKTSDNNARITFGANVVLARDLTQNEKRKVKKGKENKETDKESESVFTDKNELKFMPLYISVPVLVDDKGDFYVYELPSYTFVNSSPERISIDKNAGLKEFRDEDVEKNLEGFLVTFFESFSSDSKDKLSYILEDENYAEGLAGTLSFSDVVEAKFYEGKSKDQIIADVIVKFEEPYTKTEVTSNYMLIIIEKDNRYVVKNVNPDDLLDIIKRETSEDEESKADVENNEHINVESDLGEEDKI